MEEGESVESALVCGGSGVRAGTDDGVADEEDVGAGVDEGGERRGDVGDGLYEGIFTERKGKTSAGSREQVEALTSRELQPASKEAVVRASAT